MTNGQSPPLVYLDHAAAAPIDADVASRHDELCRRFYFNPHSTHQYADDCVRAVENAKEKLLALLGIDRTEADVIWTSGGTEANNLAILGCLRELGSGSTALIESTAHSSVIAPARAHADAEGQAIDVPVDRSGHIDLEALDVAIPVPKGALALCHVNNETGARQDLTAVRDWLNRCAPDTYLIVDALQSFTKFEIDWAAAAIDLLTLGGRKIGGPPHTGALVMRRGTPLKPIMFGGGQQKGLRPGTMDTIGIIEFVGAAERARAVREDNLSHVAMLRGYLIEGLKKDDFPKVEILSPPDASPYILNFALPGYEGAIVMRALAEKNIIVATGSACSAESTSTSHVLEAMQIDRRTARSALRVSFGEDTTPAMLDRLLAELKMVLEAY